jgi:hypothetical protein
MDGVSPYLRIDATYLKARENSRIVSVGTIIVKRRLGPPTAPAR